MANWQDPRPLFPWSAPPEQQGPRTAPKLRPNLFARMARFSVQHPVAVLLVLIFAAAAAATIVLLTLRVDFAKTAMADRTDTERRASTDLSIRFDNINSLLRVRIAADESSAAIAGAFTLASKLRDRPEQFRSVLMPELQPTEPRFAAYYLDTPELNRRVEAVRSSQAYYQLLGASPTLGGLNGVLATAKGAADAGSAPSSLPPLLNSLSAAATNLLEGKPALINWDDATGLSAPPLLPEVTLLVSPSDDDRAAALTQLQKHVDELAAANPQLRLQTETSGEKNLALQSRSTGRQFIVALCLALLFLTSLLAICFRSPRDVALALLPAGAGVLTAVAISTFVEDPLDAMSATLPLLLVPGCLVTALCYVLALGRHEKRAISTMSLIMLAAQQSGAVALAMLGVSLVLWLCWLALGPAGTPALPIGAIGGHGVAILVTYLALPTFAALVPRQKPEFIPAAAAQAGRTWPYLQNWLMLRPWAAATLLAATIASMLVLFLYEGLNGAAPANQALHIQTTSQQSAAQRIEELRSEEAVGSIVWIGDFLPADAEAKRKALTLVSGIVLPAQATTETPPGLMAEQFQQLDETLRLLAAAPEQGHPLQAAALRLRRSLALLSNTAGGPAVAGSRFERVLSTSMQGLTPYFGSLAALAPPTAAELAPALRGLFLADDGTYRIEVWPRPPVSESEFLATIRGIDAAAVYADSGTAAAAGKLPWRFVITVMACCIGIFGLSMIVLGQVSGAIQFMLVQLCTLLLFGGVVRLAGIGPMGMVEVAAFAGLSVSAMAGLLHNLANRNAWITMWSTLIGPMAAAAVVLPLVLLSVHELSGFSRAMLAFSGIIILVQMVLPAQLQQWFAQQALFDSLLRMRKPARKVVLPGVDISTNGQSDATTISTAETRQPPRPSV